MGIVDSALSVIDRVGIDPVAWESPTPPAAIGVLAPNTRLDGAERWRLPTGNGPEDVAVDHEGRVVTGAADGAIWRFGSKGRAELIANTRGRPLGIEILDDGRYLVCDCDRGVLRVDDTGRVELLTDTAVGKPLKATNNSAIGKDGVVYFTDSSSRFPISDHRNDILEHSGTGRVLRFDPATGEIDQLADGLQFANGVGLSLDESYLVVAETGSYRIRRIELTGARAGQVSVWVPNLPGIPDNLASQTKEGIFWVALYSPRVRSLDMLSGYPAIRRIVANLPQAVQPDPEPIGWVVGIDGNGRIVESLQSSKGGYSPITGVREADGWLYLGSLTADDIARVPSPTGKRGK